ncbi:MAG: S8 family peptidase [Elusimicrobiota bacterium]|nr:MAG: S8 family peptidase [Elusimicrobiota bacterium]
MGISRVGAPDAWKVSRGKGVKLAVIDTGIDMTHPELAGIIKGGWNAISTAATFNDDNGHGTHVSGTIAAKDDGAGVVGVAPQIDLYGVKVLDEGGSGTFDGVIAGMLWAIENKMEIASMSLGADQGNQALADAVEAMRKAGVILIAASGNSGGSVGYPAAYPGAIAVGASDSKDKLASFSSRGPAVAVIAPGVDVKSTYMGAATTRCRGRRWPRRTWPGSRPSTSRRTRARRRRRRARRSRPPPPSSRACRTWARGGPSERLEARPGPLTAGQAFL